MTDHFAQAGGVIAASAALVSTMQANLRRKTGGGKDIDQHQVLTRRLARQATRVEAARQLLEFAARCPEQDAGQARLIASLFAAEVASELEQQAQQGFAGFALSQQELDATVGAAAPRHFVRNVLAEENYRAVGRDLLDNGADYNRWIWSDGDSPDAVQESYHTARELRDSTRRFGREVVEPVAQEIHRQDLLVPETVIRQMAEMGFFGMSIPLEYGGIGMGNLMMIIATEELSAASLPAAGSLITRPEVLSKALLQGGTEAQKQRWLKPVARGELMVGVAVTEPDTGSDVASIRCRAIAGEENGVAGYFIDGNKAWSTFSGRANILSLLARTDPDASLGHRGLSLFVVEKDPFTGHEFEMAQPGGGRIRGKADDTMGYRGMHSFTLRFERYFVPASNLVGEQGGIGKGFYFQMGGFAGGRLQTGGRATGLAQAALRAATDYAHARSQFGKPLASYQNVAYELGAMAVQTEAARQLTYAGARAMDRGDGNAGLLCSMAKLLACRVAVEVSQKGQLMHGGWGYAEEFPIARYVADALVLPIFEGVEPILEMKVIGRQLLADGPSASGMAG